MKPDGVLKQFAMVFLVAAVAYAASYSYLQHRRLVNGPWQVTFASQAAAPAIVINQPSLKIQDVYIVFADEPADTNPVQRLEFSEARPVPFSVPFGQCIFLDPLFLPGTVDLNMFGHEIQLMPRVLTLDGKEHPWRSSETITLHRSPEPPNPSQVQTNRTTD